MVKKERLLLILFGVTLSCVTNATHGTDHNLTTNSTKPMVLQQNEPPNLPDNLTLQPNVQLITVGPAITFHGGNNITNNIGSRIQTTSNESAIMASPGSSGTTTIYNYGGIYSGGPISIDLTGLTAQGSAVINQFNGSVINGGILLPSHANITLNVHEASIGGAISKPPGGNGNATLNIKGNFTNNAEISNIQDIYVLSGVFSVHHPVTGYSHLFNQSVVSLNGGTLSAGITAQGTQSTVNVNSNFTTKGPISARDININHGAKLTANHLLTATRAVTVNTNTELELKNNIAGSLINNGTVLVETPQHIAGHFTQGPQGILKTVLGVSNTVPYGSLLVDGNALVAGKIDISCPNNGVNIQHNTSYDIIKSAAGNVSLANPTISQPASQVLKFVVASSTPNALRITAIRTHYHEIVKASPSLQGIAKALETIRLQNPGATQLNLLSALDGIQSTDEFRSTLQQFTPSAGHVSLPPLANQTLYFNKIGDRMDIQRKGGHLQAKVDSMYSGETGYVAGEEITRCHPTIGPLFFGRTAKLETQQNIPGFIELTGGLGVIGDIPLSEYIKIGAGLSYVSTGVRPDTNTGNRSGNMTTISNYQGMAFVRIDYYWPFVEVMGSLATNSFRTRRNIPFTGQVASAHFQGTQTGAKMRGGVAIPISTLEITPLAYAQYTALNLPTYSETGAPGVNLTFPGQLITAYETAFGIRLAEISEPDVFYPEIHVMAIRYIRNPNMQVTSQFSDIGPAFVTPGATISKTGSNIGGSITALLKDGLVITGAYDFESRTKYSGHNLSIRLRYLY